MKYCSSCGNELLDEAVICPKCGCAVDGKLVKKGNTNGISTMQTLALVFMIIGCIATGFCLIPLIWTIPMTVNYSSKIKNGEEVSLAFKICTLLFVSLVSGILMLCDNTNADK